MTDEDISAFGPLPPWRAGPAAPPAAPARPVPRPRRRWWPWLIAAALVTGLLVALAVAAALLGLLDSAQHGLQVWFDGGDGDGDPGWLTDGALLAGLHAHGAGLVFGLALALGALFVTVAVIVPLAILIGLVAAALGVGGVLLFVAAVVAVIVATVLSPLWLLVFVLWLLLRRRRPAGA